MRWKQPGEARIFTYDFTELLAGQLIGSVQSVVSVPRTVGAANMVQVGASNVGATAIQVEWDGGDDGVSYLTTVKVLDGAGEVHELDGEILVADVEFTLPLGIASAYLTGEEYIDRFGYEETVRLTDQDRKQTIDGARLQAAISDAAELAESFLGVRYPLPLTPVPNLVKGLIADLAREKLFAQRPILAATQAADRARLMLRDLSSGRMTLAVDTGTPLTPTAAGLAAWGSVDATVFNSDKLCGFGQGL